MSSRKNRGDRKDRRENVSLRSLHAWRFFLFVLMAWSSLAQAQPRLTFNKEIAPIISQRCATCHRPGEIGPFSLLTYDDVKRHAAQIAAVTKQRFMPPWLPEAGHGEFEEERRL